MTSLQEGSVGSGVADSDWPRVVVMYWDIAQTQCAALEVVDPL